MIGFILLFIDLFYFWLLWVFVAVRGLSLVAASGGHALAAVHSLLTLVGSLLVDHGL